MLKTMIRHEFKNMLRERMTQMLFFYPMLMGLVVRYLISRGTVKGIALELSAMLLVLLTGMLFGSIAGMSLLDDRDDLVVYSIQISPVPLWKYIWLKIAVISAMAFIDGIMIILISGAFDMRPYQMIIVSLLSSMQVPINAFMMNAFAKNKVEGFVAMKATGFLMVFPIVGFFFRDAKEWFFAFAPGHWVTKAVQRIALEPMITAGLARMNLGFASYVAIGFFYNALLIALTYGLYRRKNPY
ncbi:MAG TPA: hypothetical protein PKK63_04180 [Bacillota bacterium]|nr:MAG: hypothetical protein BWY00_01009 [Firmicutes bacterium ADurb.Bin153]HNV34713.1 hypothetical protein [Bacillota bacterium]